MSGLGLLSIGKFVFLITGIRFPSIPASQRQPACNPLGGASRSFFSMLVLRCLLWSWSVSLFSGIGMGEYMFLSHTDTDAAYAEKYYRPFNDRFFQLLKHDAFEPCAAHR